VQRKNVGQFLWKEREEWSIRDIKGMEASQIGKSKLLFRMEDFVESDRLQQHAVPRSER
jgi:hypothetical protein